MTRFRFHVFVTLLVLFLGQAGLYLHEITADHHSEEVCEVCSGYSRATAVGAQSTPVGFIAAFFITVIASGSSLYSSKPSRALHLRGPPSF